MFMYSKVSKQEPVYA